MLKAHSMLPDWVFRIGWGTPVARDYLKIRMEADQLGVSIPQAREARQALNSRVTDQTKQVNSQGLRWAIKTPVPAAAEGDKWGDLYFAQEIAAALIRKGQQARVDRRCDLINSNSAKDDVILVLRGVERIQPQSGAVNLLWIISHPSRISKNELKSFDQVFAASTSWSLKRSKQIGIEIMPLLQATNAEKFNPDSGKPDSGHSVLFIGNTRKRFRRIIKDAISVGIEPKIYGQGWDKFVSEKVIAGTFVPNSEVSAQYRAAGVVLNDHWPDMAKCGFISNRLFDAAASGARVISDEVQGITELFDGAVQTYKTPEQLAGLISPSGLTSFGSPEYISERARRIGTANSFNERVGHLIAAAQKVINHNAGN